MRRLDDPRTMRALAHPIRIQLIEQLTLRGPMTATQCAARIGESPSSCSFHLRMLAKYGFVVEAEGGTGRQRPWRVVTLGSRWDADSDTPAALRTAGETLAALVRVRDRQLHDEYLARADEFEPDWVSAAVQSNFGGYLTPAELRDIGDRLYAMWAPYIDRLAADPAERPPGARLVHMAAYGFPRADSLDDSTDRDPASEPTVDVDNPSASADADADSDSAGDHA